MAMKKIPTHVQSLISASNQINSYHKAIEELVYNALDADATSIAIRINIHENTIQVIDNGFGVCEKDFKYIGQKFMTSKLVDLSTLKSAPDKYGFRGQSLANLINVSKNVRVISRHEISDGTWMKLFEHGKEKQLKVWTSRPSKGTTVEIKGFLYNLSIQNKSKDNLSELQSIKTFLEHLSLVHNNISLSLRDDSKNEIIFKMHKNRDMYQTLSTLYNVGKEDVQELKVEKNEYKVTAFLGKNDKDIGRHFIFLNGKFISGATKLHKIVKNSLSRNSKSKGITKPNTKNISKDEECLLFKKTPFYFIFIKCPYMNYELSNSTKHSILEFKDWNQVNTLLEKLIKFFNGDMNLRELSKVEVNKANREEGSIETRKQVKKIMDKILGSNCKKPTISHMHKGIKGKQVKRKNKKHLQISSSKLTNNKENLKERLIDIDIRNKAVINDNDFDSKNRNAEKKHKLQLCDIFLQSPKPSHVKKMEYHRMKTIKLKKTNKYSRMNVTKSCLGTRIGKSYNRNFKKVSKNNEILNNNQTKKLSINQTKKCPLNCNNIIRKFELETDSVKKRCDELDKRTKKILDQRRNRKCEVFVQGNVQYSNVTNNNIKYSVRKQIDEIIIHDYFPRAPENFRYEKSDYKVCASVTRKQFPSNYDLIQTILNSQQNKYSEIQTVDKPKLLEAALDQKYVGKQTTDKSKHLDPVLNQLQRHDVTSGNHCLVNSFTCCNSIQSPRTMQSHNFTDPVVTYQSHNYYAHRNVCNTQHINHNDDHTEVQEQEREDNDYEVKTRTFMSKKSRDNFMVSSTTYKRNTFKNKTNTIKGVKPLKSTIKKMFQETSKLFALKNKIMANSGRTSYTIDFSENNYEVGDIKIPERVTDSSNPSMNIEQSWSNSINCDDRVCNRDNKRVLANTNRRTDIHLEKHNGYTINHDCNIYSNYTIEHTTKRFDEQKLSDEDINTDKKQYNNKNFIFVSESQNHDENGQILDPIIVCEAILQTPDILQREFEISFSNQQDDHFCIDNELNNQNHADNQKESNVVLTYENHLINDVENLNLNIEEIMSSQNISEVSRHFTIPNSNHKNVGQMHPSPILNTRPQKNIGNQNDFAANDINQKGNNFNDFSLKNRLCFVPKGMSPIFENCHTKNVWEYNLSADYYEDEIYNNFADNVKINAEIYKPRIQEAKDVTTKAIDKVNTKINKDNSTLKFDGQSLKEAKVLGQIDDKFIAAIMTGRNDTNGISHFLVLFDQHAVDERIRLENNLSEYLNENQWKPVSIDEVTLKMRNDYILYLHNYKDKFEQLGLQWTVANSDEVTFTAIPQAILGKNPRQADRVIQAVKNLIIEEINIINIQGGCVSLYPKSIMELVFSEACRYAIKFGDKLSKSECMELLTKLSNCKTPFQCAHGRPVMAVIMEVKLHAITDYKVKLDKVSEWKELNT